MYGYGYNGDTDFLKWYKKNYGADYSEEAGFSRKEGMSDAEYDVGSQLYNSYLSGRELNSQRTEQKNTVNNIYNNAITDVSNSAASSREALEDSKNRSEEHAYITHQRLQKYLPMIDKAQGYGGAGAQGTAGLKAYNEYMTQMGSIGSEYDKNLRAINESEAEKKAELERYRSSELGSIDEKFDGFSRDLSKDTDTDVRSLLEKYFKQDYEAAETVAKNTDSRNMTDFEADFRQKYGAKFDEPTMSAFLAVAGNKINDNVKADDKEQYESVYRYLAASPSVNVSDLQKYVQEQYPEREDDPNYKTLMAYAQTRASENKSLIYDGSAIADFNTAVASGKMSADELQKMLDDTSYAMTDEEKRLAQGAIDEARKEEEKARILAEQAEEEKRVREEQTAIIKEQAAPIQEEQARINVMVQSAPDKYNRVQINIPGNRHPATVAAAEITDRDILSVAEHLTENAVFKYGEWLHVRIGNKVYRLAPADFSELGLSQYSALENAFGAKSNKGWTANGTLR